MRFQCKECMNDEYVDIESIGEDEHGEYCDYVCAKCGHINRFYVVDTTVNDNWFLEYAKEGYDRNDLQSFYIGAINNILDNEIGFTEVEQIKSLNNNRKKYNEAIEFIYNR